MVAIPREFADMRSCKHHEMCSFQNLFFQKGNHIFKTGFQPACIWFQQQKQKRHQYFSGSGFKHANSTPKCPVAAHSVSRGSTSFAYPTRWDCSQQPKDITTSAWVNVDRPTEAKSTPRNISCFSQICHRCFWKWPKLVGPSSYRCSMETYF